MSTSAWLLMPAATLALLALAAGRRWGVPVAGGWAAAAVLGQWGVLSLIKAGPGVGYQHFAGLVVAKRDQPLALALTACVVVAAVVGAAHHWRRIIGWLRTRERPWAWILAVLGASVLAAAPSASPAAYARELAVAALLQLCILSCMVFAAMAVPDEAARRIATMMEGAGATTGRPGRFVWGLAAFVTVVSAALCLTSYQAIGHVPDEIAYVMQARYFAAGLPWVTAPSVPAAFDTFLIEVSGDRWYSVFPPGWPAMLAIGVRLGVPWLVNPVLGGACVLLTWHLVHELSDRRTAGLSSALLAASPWHLFLSMSFMSHVLSLLLALCTALGAARAWRTGAWRPAFAGGLALGVLGMSRPLEGVAVAALAGVPLLVAAARQARAGALAAAALGTAITGSLGLAYNAVLTGSPWRFPAEVYFDREFGPGKYSIGFGPEKGMGWVGLDPYPGHGPVDVVVNAALNSFMVNIELFGWALGSAGIVLLGLFHARRRIDRIMVATIAVVVGVHSAFWFSGGPDFGARYWYIMIVPCTVLAVRGLESFADGTGRGEGAARATLAAGFLVVCSLLLFVPWRAADKYPAYRGVRADLVSWPRDPRFRDGLILIRGPREVDWAGAAMANEVDPGRTRAPVFAADRDDATRRAVMDAFPTRDVWLVSGPSETGSGYTIIRGPVKPADRATIPR